MPSIFEATAGRHIGPTESGSAVQQQSKTTGVTINACSGTIVTSDESIGGNSEKSFTVTNDRVSAGDVVLVTHTSGGTSGGYLAQANDVKDGQFNITMLNLFGNGLAETITLSFVLFKAGAS